MEKTFLTTNLDNDSNKILFITDGMNNFGNKTPNLHFVPVMFKTNCSNGHSIILKQFPHIVFTESHWIISNVDFKGCPKYIIKKQN